VEFLAAQYLENPEDGLGLQQAVLEEVASGDRGPTALVWTSSRYVGATRPETRLPDFEKAVEAAVNLGFPVLVRNSGGGAVAANEGSISFSLTFPVEDLRHGLYERYTEGVELVAAALRRIGVDAEGGEVEGEFCPGAYSVRSGGPSGVKHAGLAQRVTRRAARVEALILVSKTAEIASVLERFYGALGLPFRRESVADLPTGVPRVIEALAAEVRERYGGGEGTVDAHLLAEARSLRDEWRLPQPGPAAMDEDPVQPR
jgi:octanoyl-[GcvH]:protein N-octanoyltransferase